MLETLEREIDPLYNQEAADMGPADTEREKGCVVIFSPLAAHVCLPVRLAQAEQVGAQLNHMALSLRELVSRLNHSPALQGARPGGDGGSVCVSQLSPACLAYIPCAGCC
jgi:hypothetical protein